MPPVLPCLVHLPGTGVSLPAPAWGGDLDGVFVLVHGLNNSTHVPRVGGDRERERAQPHVLISTHALYQGGYLLPNGMC